MQTPSTSILALDLATVTGWAKWRKHVTSFGTVTFGGRGTLFVRVLTSYRDWLAAQIKEGGFQAVIFESPYVGPRTHQATARVLLGLAAVTELVCNDHGVRCMEANNASVLKHWTGRGGGKRKDKKARTLAACNERGFHPRDDDEADALALLDYAAHCLGIKTDIPEGPLFGERAGEAA